VHERTCTTRIRGLACLSAAAIAVLTAAVPSAEAENPIDEAQIAAGRAWYDKYCTPCHGPGGGPGDTAVDLRSYVARHGGKFPASQWIAVVTDANPRSPHSDVWQRIRDAQAGMTMQTAVAHGVVAQIAQYIMSVQGK
jgi:mono/diheme cytochrome c family protein